MNAKNNDLTEIINHQQAEIANLRQQLSVAQTQATTSNLYLNNILADLPEHVFWMDKEGRIIGCNEKQANTIGLASSAELKGKNIYDVADLLGWDKSIADKIRQNDLEIMQSGAPKAVEELIIINGQERIMLAFKKPLKDEQGNIIGIMGTASDITERKKLENDLKIAEVKASDERILLGIYLENIITTIPEHLYWIDKNNILLGCNDMQAKSFGYTNKHQVIGKSIRELGLACGWGETIIENIYHNNEEIIVTKNSKVLEENAIFHDEYRTFLSYKSPLIGQNNEVIGILGVTVDITERKKMENELVAAKNRAEQANKAKSEFVINMSHDIRTPLNGIVGVTQILKQQEKDSLKLELLDDLLTASNSLTALLTEIIDLANFETFGLTIKNNNFNLQQIINELFALFNAEARNKNVQLITDIPENLPDITSDKLRVHRILLNLLGNALKFTTNGKVSIHIEIVEKSSTNITLKVIVSDTGIGMAKDKLQNIFDKFYRLTSSESSPYKGNGLGLYIVKQFITDLKGKIMVESELNVGSKFICVLPFKIN